MLDIYIDNIPIDLLNIIYHFIKPSIKYCLCKQNFIKYYYARFIIINNTFYHHYIINNKLKNLYVIKNYKYIKYLIKNDIFLIIKFIIDYKFKYDISYYFIKKPFIFENFKYNNFIDFCYYFSYKFNSTKLINFFNPIIIQNNIKITSFNNINKSNFNYKKNKNFKNKNKIWNA